jgi:hypothetical protein
MNAFRFIGEFGAVAIALVLAAGHRRWGLPLWVHVIPYGLIVIVVESHLLVAETAARDMLTYPVHFLAVLVLQLAQLLPSRRP